MKPVLITLFGLLFLASCTKWAGDSDYADKKDMCRVNIVFGINASEISSRSLIPEQESEVSDINIYAQHSQTGVVRHLFLSGTTAASLSLPSGMWEFYAFANFGYDMGDRIVQELTALTVATDTEDALAEGSSIRMSLHETVEIAGDVALQLKLVRLAAKVQVNVEVAPAMSERIEIHNIRMCCVPASARYIGDNDAVSFTDYDPHEVAGSAFARTFYLPENLAGTVPEITLPQERSVANAPTNATRIAIEATCDGRPVTYYAYPGGNETSDFNIRHNHDYILNISLYGANPEDMRLSTCDLVLSEPEGRANVGDSFTTTLTFTATNITDNTFDFAFKIQQGRCTVKVDGKQYSPGTFGTVTVGTATTRSFEITVESTGTDEAGTAQIEFTASNRQGENLTRTLIVEFLVPEQIDIYTTYSYGLTAQALNHVENELHASVSFSIVASTPLPGPLTIAFDYRWGSKYTNGDLITDNRYSYTLETAAGVRGSGVELFNGDKQGEPCPVYNSDLGYYTRHGYTMLSGGSLHITYLSDPPPGYVYNLKPVTIVYRNPVN